MKHRRLTATLMWAWPATLSQETKAGITTRSLSRLLGPKTLMLPFALLLLASGCSNKMKMANPKSKRNHPQSIAAIINGTPIFWESVDRRGRGFLKDEKEVGHLAFAPAQEAEALDHFRRRAAKIEVMRHLLLEDAKQHKIVVTEGDRRKTLARLEPLMAQRHWTTNDFFTRSPLGEEQTRLEFEESIYIDKLLETVVAKDTTVTAQDMEETIAKWAALRQEKIKRIQALHVQLVAGADFAQTAAQFSECPASRKKGGSLGEFARGTLGGDVERTVFALTVGGISAVTETKDGFHIFKVTAHNPAQSATATTPSLPETIALSQIMVRFKMPKTPEIRQHILRAKIAQRTTDYYRELAGTADIKSAFPDLTFVDMPTAR